MSSLPPHQTENNTIQSKPETSRRAFLKNSLSIGLGLGLGLGSSFWVVSCKNDTDSIETIWDKLAHDLQGVLLRPNDSIFIEKSSPWALRFAQKLPQAIAVCINEADVRTSLLWAKKHQIPLVARSGGHSYAAYSTTTGLLIDVSNLINTEYNSSNGLLTIGGGARNKHVYDKCKPLNRAITHGRCLEVGVAGLVLGGGIGFNMRSYGYTCDQLKETRIVLGDGQILTCNETENSDLFWACRGAGGGNFGIHTSFTFQTFAVDTISAFSIEWTEKIPETFVAIQNMTDKAPDTLGLKFRISAQKKGGVNNLNIAILGQFRGSIAELNTLLSQVYSVQTPSSSFIEEMPYWDAQEFISEEGGPEYSHERSRFIQNKLPDDAIQTILTNLNSWPGTSKSATWKYFLLGGQVDSKSSTAMAMAHRGYKMLSSIELDWSTDDSPTLISLNEEWSHNFHNQMEQYTSKHSYQNFIDPDQTNYLEAYYGNNLSQLKTVKKKYDPNNIFNYPQSIPLT